MKIHYLVAILILFSACTMKNNSANKGSYGYDLQFLSRYYNGLIELKDSTGTSKIIILPELQGRVMSSTAQGDLGQSFGWINHDLIASGKPSKHMSAFGGEERFWLGPEGGQFSIYFKKNVPFTFENWFVPKEIDTEPFEVVSKNLSEVIFKKEMHVENHSGHSFSLEVGRKITLLASNKISKILGVDFSNDIQIVGYQSENSIKNIGTKPWDRSHGMLSIWILSMLNASEKTMVVAPYQEGSVADLGPIVTDDYFGKVPLDRLRIENGLIFFKADAKYRSKIGISPQRARPFISSYDSDNGVLTIAQFDLPHEKSDYVNSKWEIQKDPFSGDAVNAYNDGLNEGNQLGKFYEIESSSPAAALSVGQQILHTHRTIHLKGPKNSLDIIAKKLLGISLGEIK